MCLCLGPLLRIQQRAGRDHTVRSSLCLLPIYQLTGPLPFLTHMHCRTTIYPILTRLGIDVLAGRITRLRDDDRFRAIGPDTFVLLAPQQGISNSEGEKEAELWFDWAFVDFWKSNYCAYTRFPLTSHLSGIYVHADLAR